MKRLLTLAFVLGLMTTRAGMAANLLLNGSLDAPSPGATINHWTKDESLTLSGPTSDLITLEPWVEIGPSTNADPNLDLGGFLKSFQGNATTGDLATLHLTQDVPGVPGLLYRLSGWIGAGVNYSGLLDGPTQTELAIEFDADNDRANGFLSSSVLDVKAAGLTSGPAVSFGAQEFTVRGTAPAGTVFVRARFSMIDAYNTMNPDPAAFIDDFSLTVVPEPASVILALIGFVGVFAFCRRR